MEKIVWVGVAAAVLTTISYLPQVIKIWKTKSTEDISLLMFILLCSGIMLWLIYGSVNKLVPVIIGNAVSFSLSFVVLILKIKHR